MNVLSIGYDRELFSEQSAGRGRIDGCAKTVDVLHMIVFSRRYHWCVPAHDDNLFLHPTGARTRLGMLCAAYRLGSSLVRANREKKDSWVISAQDPFEAGLVGYLLHLRYGIPLQVQEHGDFFGSMWWRDERALNRARYVFGKWLLHRGTCVRAASRRVARHLAVLGVDPLRISTLEVASELTAFRAAEPVQEERDLRAQYPSAEAVILAVGRLVKEKNFSLLIRAFETVVRKHPTARLVIVGSGPEKDALTKLVEKNMLSGSVSFIPWTDDVASYMKSADIFILSSYREGYGRVIIEAMAAGLPGVVTDVGCVGEVFFHERHGLVVPVDDIAAMACALMRLVADSELRRRYGANASRDVATFAAAQSSYATAWRVTLERCVAAEQKGAGVL